MYLTETNKWYALNIKGDVPSPRASFALETDGERVFLFGGTDGTRTFNDLYLLDLDKLEWIHLKPNYASMTNLPKSRLGCSLTYSDGEFYLFGGMHMCLKKKGERFVCHFYLNF